MAYQFISKTFFTVFLIAIISLLLMLPELGFIALVDNFSVTYPARHIIIIAVIALCLWFGRSTLLSYLVLGVLSLIYLVQFAHFSFFGRAIDPFAFGLFIIESEDITKGILGSLGTLYWVIPLSILPIVLITVLLKRLRPANSPQFLTLSLIPLLILSFGVYRTSMFTEGAGRAFPTVERPVIENFITAFGGFLYHTPLDLPEETLNYPLYEIQSAPVLQTGSTVVVVFGESLSGNNISALDYDRETTPELSQLLEQYNGTISKGISSGVSTRISTSLFFNLIRDPRDYQNITAGVSNLFRLAKQQDMDTYYLSAQGANLLSGTKDAYIDHMITLDNNTEAFAQKRDEYLIDLVNQINWKPNRSRFIVVHSRSAHFPYTENYENRTDLAIYPDNEQYDYQKRMRNQYDNAVRYTDSVYADIYRSILKNSSGDVYYWMTSDHGEMIGEKGLYGHATLSEVNSAIVPFLFLSNQKDTPIQRKFAQRKTHSHVDFGRLIAENFGITLKDNTPKPDARYISGSGFFGTHGVKEAFRTKEGLWTLSP